MIKTQIIQGREFATDHVALKKRLRSFLRDFRAQKITRELVGDDEWSAELDDIEAEFSDAAVVVPPFAIVSRTNGAHSR
ncbi:hypothetical protein AQS8620_03186 [Aquimixticola soesokkakensis]|uniref:Uncharacterized protein n=1 Tax=Aquimixticola soesokkakensis TaxID=1519096 RepID=A0A1Y5TNJ2_9RHOB|nr:hypothetical protein [Aquimixticola soesokkakensis]SLN67822.1 hypothetical protein AQS8620_03186 [Aquimixticola soesokkakensis]